MNTAVIALGSNLQNPQQQIQAAVAALTALPQLERVRVSSLYCSAPVGYRAQPDFINAVLLVETNLTAVALLAVLQAIENRFGRVRHFRNAPRTLDLDIIDYAGQTCDTPDLQLPHPRAHERLFVMAPLAEVAPDYPLGSHGSAAALARALAAAAPDGAVQKLSPPSIF